MDTSPETSDVEPKDTGPVTGSKISESLLAAGAGALARQAAMTAAARAGVSPLVMSTVLAYRAAKRKKGINAKSVKAGAVSIATAPTTKPKPPKSVL